MGLTIPERNTAKDKVASARKSLTSADSDVTVVHGIIDKAYKVTAEKWLKTNSDRLHALPSITTIERQLQPVEADILAHQPKIGTAPAPSLKRARGLTPRQRRRKT